MEKATSTSLLLVQRRIVSTSAEPGANPRSFSCHSKQLRRFFRPLFRLHPIRLRPLFQKILRRQRKWRNSCCFLAAHCVTQNFNSRLVIQFSSLSNRHRKPVFVRFEPKCRIEVSTDDLTPTNQYSRLVRIQARPQRLVTQNVLCPLARRRNVSDNKEPFS